MRSVSGRLAGALLTAGVMAFGAPTASAQSGSSGWGTITEFHMRNSSDYFVIKFSEPIVNPAGCGGEEYYIAELTGTAEQQNRFVSIVMSAFLTNKTVSLWINGCTAGTYWGQTRPAILDIYVKPN